MKLFLPSFLLSFLLWAALVVSTPVLAQVSVGWDAQCDYDATSDPQALQTAIDDGHQEIRLSNAQAYAGVVDITANVRLRGGYPDCQAAVGDAQTTTNSIIDGSGFARTVVTMENIENADIRLEHLEITGGDGTSTHDPGGLRLRDLVGNVALHHLKIHLNSGNQGGAAAVSSGSSLTEGTLTVNLTETVLSNNSAETGGALHCSKFQSSFSIQLVLSDGSTVRGNHAEQNGGGFHINGCDLDFIAGQATHGVSGEPGMELSMNTSNDKAGGLYVQAGLIKLQGTPSLAFDLSNNQSNLDTELSGQGGAAQITGSGRLELTNAHVVGNSSGRYGGALFAGFGGEIVMRSAATGCTYSRFCSVLRDNRLTRTFPGGGGAVAARFGGRIEIHTSLVAANDAKDNGYIGYAEQANSGQDATMVFEGNVITGNGLDDDFESFTAFYLKSDSTLVLAYNTVVDNLPASGIISQQNGSELLAIGNVFNEQGNIHGTSGTVASEISCNLFNSLDSIEVAVTDAIEGTLNHIDPANSDFRLALSDTIAIDVCGDVLYAPGSDLAGRTRGIDRTDVSDLNGLFDLGAYEFDPVAADTIFVDNFSL